MYQYSREEINNIRIKVKRNHHEPLDKRTLKRLEYLGIRRRKRGKKGGRRRNQTKKATKKVQARKDVPVRKRLNVKYMNAHSVNNKSEEISQLIIDGKIDLLLVTETWIQGNEEDFVTRSLTPVGYNLIHVPKDKSRGKKRGGGVGIIHRSNLAVTKQKTENYKTFELLEVLFKAGNHCVSLSMI